MAAEFVFHGILQLEPLVRTGLVRLFSHELRVQEGSGWRVSV
jgi:hypothetical protein